MNALIDNDILIKGACYRFLTELANGIPGDGHCGVLGAARFVVPHYIKRQKLRGDLAAAEVCFFSFLAGTEALEPSSEEQELAAALEANAQKLSFSLDAGESQLVAILVSRVLPWLATGDKRAIAALEKLLDTDARLANLAGKIRCLEQLVKQMLLIGDYSIIRNAICSEPTVDKTLTTCFSCSSQSPTNSANIHQGLDSYIGAVRASAVRVLAT
jgi:hypothetical protein